MAGRIGFLAFELGRPRLAQAQLENAAQAIEIVYAVNPAAELARSNFAREDVKDFRGEPFERAMVVITSVSAISRSVTSRMRAPALRPANIKTACRAPRNTKPISPF